MQPRSISLTLRMVSLVCILLLCAMPGAVAKAKVHQALAQSDTTTLPTSRIGGAISHLAIYNTFVYLYTGYELVIVDITNPAAISTVGRITELPDRISDLRVAGHFLYMAIPDITDEVRIFDLTQPTSPQLVAVWRHQDGSIGDFKLTVSENTAYVMLDDGVHVINLTEPTAPTAIALFPRVAEDFDVVGNYGYLASGGLHVVDLTNIKNMVEVAKTEQPVAIRNGIESVGSLVDVEIVGNYAYAAADSAGLQIVDISNPLTPTVVSLLTTIPDAKKVLVHGDYAVVMGIWGTFLVDITDPQAPQLMNPTPLFQATDIALYNDTLAMVNGNFHLFALGDTTPLTETGFYQSTWPVNSLALRYNTAYLGAANTVYQFTVDDVAQPTLQNILPLSATISSLAVAGNYLYSTVGLQGLQVIELADTAPVRVISQLPIPGYAQRVEVFGQRAIVVSGPDQELGKIVSIVDVTNPHTPQLLGSVSSDPTIMDFVIQDRYLYLSANTDNEDAFRIFDLIQPATPQKVLGLNKSYVSLTLYEGAIYAVDFDSNIVKVDITTPTKPNVAWSLKTAGNMVSSLAFVAHKLYVRSLTFDFPSGADHGVEVFALNATMAPSPLSAFPVNVPCRTFWVRNTNLYCFANEDGSLAFAQLTTALYLPILLTQP